MTAIAQRSLASGEIAPSLYARCDQTRYATGCRTLRNMYVMRHGGATSRPGTRLVCEVLATAGNKDPLRVRLIPFIFNATQTYVIEIGTSPQYIRVHKDGATVLHTALDIESITNADPAEITITAHGLSNGDEIYVTGIVGMTELNGKRFIVSNSATDTFDLVDYDGNNIDSSAFGAYVSDGTVQKIVKIAGLWAGSSNLPLLQFDQSADILTLTYPSTGIVELSRTSHTSWSTATISSFGPTQAAPTGLAGGPGAGNYAIWAVTAVSALTGEESLMSNFLTSSAAPTTASPIGIGWTAPAGTIAYYNIYKFTGAWGFYGTAQSNSFTDNGLGVIDFSFPPPVINDFATPKTATAFTYPNVVASCQQRKLYSGIADYPGKIWASRIGLRKNFAQKAASLSDDPIAFTMIGKQVNEVRHILDLGEPVVFTSGGEFSLEGNASGGLTPTEVNPKQHSSHGAAAYPPPLIIDGSAVYVQARGGVIRDLGFHLDTENYRGDELSLFSAHLLEGHTVVDWAYQETPHRVLWIVLDNGALLSLTYVKEQQIVGWARHDTDGLFESVCVVPEGGEDAVYFVVRRVINGKEKSYIERMASRFVTEDTIDDYVGMDCALSYDGRAQSLFDAGTISSIYDMTLSGGTTWDYDETLTLTSSDPFFAASDVGNAMHLTGSDGTLIIFTIAGFTSSTVVTGSPDKVVPAAMQSVVINDWAKAVDVVSGLEHLEGKEVSVFADGNVVASPNNPECEILTVTSGSVTLDQPYAVITVGLPYLCDIETLDIDSAQGETMVDKKKLITQVSLHIEKTRGVFTGPKPPTDDDTNAVENLFEMRHETPDSLQTDVKTLNILPQWNSNGRVFVRQVDPLPMTVLAISPTGMVPLGKAGA